MGRPKLMLYSLVLQPPDPLFKHYHQAIRPGTCALHPPCTLNEGLTKALLASTPLFLCLTWAFTLSVAAPAKVSASCHVGKIEAETLAGAATAAIVSDSPWYKRPSLPDKPFTFFLTLSTSLQLTRCYPSCAYYPWSSCLSTLLFLTPLTTILSFCFVFSPLILPEPPIYLLRAFPAIKVLSILCSNINSNSSSRLPSKLLKTSD
ncbi:hypothetical protein O181_106413 [Austropuccinia psidii MF-1]|uniref:Uncharacterized protein n=1 Tax=Austropuccinia psidii MF-1 TaxID=1389203 RepID=A0A9Q3JQQ5_9BASI|nr:hypothetical protein [Austropuccinia psidii MF-1]